MSTLIQAQTIECTRFAYTIKDLLKNAVIQAESLLQPNMCSGRNTDETFRLLKDNWVLHAFCCRGLQQSIKGATQFDFELTHPFAFVHGESSGIKFLFRVTAEALIKFFNFELQFINAFCQDRSPLIANTVQSSIWSDCKVVLCWPHIIIDRRKLKNKGLVVE